MGRTIFEAYNDLKKQLQGAGIEDSIFEAKQIIKHITGYSNSQILMKYNEKLTEFQENNLTVIIKQRQVRYPLQYILGKWDFFGRSFFVGPGVLIPRPDTETVIECCKEALKGKEKPQILDLCSGTGCIGITLGAELKESKVICLEKYMEAIDYIIKNIAHNESFNVTPLQGDVFEGTAADGKYDLIVSNPPYVTAHEMTQLQPELAFEPETALLGGEDGLDFYRVITEKYKGALSEGGTLLFEIGAAQGEAVARIMKEQGFTNVEIRKDLAKNDRVVFGTVKGIQ